MWWEDRISSVVMFCGNEWPPLATLLYFGATKAASSLVRKREIKNLRFGISQRSANASCTKLDRLQHVLYDILTGFPAQARTDNTLTAIVMDEGHRRLSWKLLAAIMAANLCRMPHTHAFPVSTSLNGIGTEPVLLDLFKSSRKFGSVETPWDSNCSVSETTGWPTADNFGVVIDWEPVANARMAFTATCGSEPIFRMSKPLNVSNPLWDESTKVYTATITSPANCDVAGVPCDLFLFFRNTSGGCNQIALMQNGVAPNPPAPSITTTAAAAAGLLPTRFSPRYLAAVKNFAHLRMMDWGQTNNNPVARWEERTPVAWSVKTAYSFHGESTFTARDTTRVGGGAPDGTAPHHHHRPLVRQPPTTFLQPNTYIYIYIYVYLYLYLCISISISMYIYVSPP